MGCGGLPGRPRGELTEFVGRRAELALVRPAVSDARLVTLTVLGGIGKTRLALQAASGARRAGRDGARLAGLGGHEPGGFMPRAGIVGYFGRYAAAVLASARAGIQVLRVEPAGGLRLHLLSQATRGGSEMRVRIVAAVALAASLSAASLLAVAPSSARAEQSPAAPATVALAWNANAVAAVRAASVIDPQGTAPRRLYQTEGLLYMSYVQAAVYDAATKIGHRYVPYHRFSVAAGNASLPAAVIAAAYNTLVFYLGDPGGTLAAKYAASIGALPGDQVTARGIAVGQAAAADIEVLRADDGRNAPVSTPFGAGPLQPGLWVWAPPPSPQIAQTPWMAVMRPFMLQSTSQFRAAAPPALTSALYTSDFNETKAYGSATSAVRTPAQTAIAYFWNANAINQLNQTLQNVATQHNMDLLDTVRLLAAGNMVPTDAGMACFDSKYTHQFWRPVTAIRNADSDGNPATTADPAWAPLVTTPNHPEYPSQHGCVTSALAQVLANALGTSSINATIPGAQGGATTLTTSQTFATVRDLYAQLVNARVWIGFHFRNSVVAGENLGTAVAGWELQRYFLPTDDGD